MTNLEHEGLVSPSDIADIAGVSRGAVSNWRKRNKTFPKAASGTPSKPLFARGEVIQWLEEHARKTHNQAVRPGGGDTAEMNVWSALNLVRDRLSVDDAAELMLSLAVARKTKGNVPLSVPNIPEHTLGLVKEAVARVKVSDLATAADFALERLARSQGKLGADFGFVGSRTTTLLANLAASRTGATLYDPACGIGAALVESVQRGARPGRLVGHDINRRALHIAAQRAALHDIHIELTLTDVLSEDVDPTLRANTVVLEPPFGLRLNAPRRLTDERFDFGAPPRSSADTAWLQHAIAHLADDGRAYVLTPAGTLFRGGEEGRIRAELVKHGCVEAIVGLPGKLLPHTSIPLALWVLRRPVPEAATGPVLLIDASDAVSPEHNVATWLTEPRARASIPHAAVPITDVLAAEALLTPQRWVDRAEREPSDVADAYQQGWAAITDTMIKLQNVLASFKHFANFSKSRVMTVGDLLDQGVLDMRVGRPEDRYEDAPEELRARIATASDIRDGTLRSLGIDGQYDGFPELTRERDVLVTTMNSIRARVDEAGGHLPSTGVYRLRVLDREVLSPGYLATALSGTWNERFQGGTTIQRAPIKDLEVPLLPVTEQRDIQLAMVAIQLLHDHSASLAKEASNVGAALLDAVRYNAHLEDPNISGPAGEDYAEDSKGAQ